MVSRVKSKANEHLALFNLILLDFLFNEFELTGEIYWLKIFCLKIKA